MTKHLYVSPWRESQDYMVRVKYPTPKFTRAAYFDLETYQTSKRDTISGLGGDLADIGLIYPEENQTQFLDNDMRRLWDAMLERPMIYRAHNGGKYDFLYLWPYIQELDLEIYDVQIIPQGDNGIIGFVITKKENKKWRLTIQDTFPILPSSLKKLAKAFTNGKKKVIDIRNYDPNNPEHREYLHLDCFLLREVVEKFEHEVWELFQCPMGWTASSTGMMAAKACLPEGKIVGRIKDLRIDDFIRRSAGGGINIPGGKNGEYEGYVYSLDMSGAYRMWAGMPLPTSQPIYRKTYLPEKEGVWKVRVITVPASLAVQPLYNSETRQLYNGDNYISYAWTHAIEAAKKWGVVLEVIEGFYFERWEPLLSPLMEKCLPLERQKLEYPAKKEVAKILGNGVVGKSLEAMSRKSLKIGVPELNNSHQKPYIDSDTGEEVEHLYTDTTPNIKNHMLPHWNSYITSRQRLAMMELANECHQISGMLPAMDTDSIKLPEAVFIHMRDRFTIIEDQHIFNYGEWTLEHIIEHFHPISSKNNLGIDKDTGEPVQRCKGIPLRVLPYEDQKRAAQGECIVVRYESLTSLSTTIKKKGEVPFRKMVKRTVSRLDNSEAWVVDAQGIIHVNRELRREKSP